MSRPSQPTGPSSFEMQIMQNMANNSSHHDFSGGSIGGGGELMGTNLSLKDKMLNGNLGSAAIDFGIGGMDRLNSLFGSGVLNNNPFKDVGDGTLVGQGNINAFQEIGQGMYNTIGNISLSDGTSIVTNTNAKIPSLTPSKNQGHGHGH